MRPRPATVLILAAVQACTGPQADGPPRDAGVQADTAPAASSTPCPTGDSDIFAGTELADRDGWYGAQLRALRERGLCADGNVASDRFRFSWIPTFHPSVVVLAERTPSGPRLTAKILSGAGGYEPGTVQRARFIELSESEWTELLNLITASQFSTAPQAEPPRNAIGADGAQWILEGVRNGRYNVVDRWSPRRDGPYARHRAVGEWLLRRSGLVPPTLLREY